MLDYADVYPSLDRVREMRDAFAYWYTYARARDNESKMQEYSDAWSLAADMVLVLKLQPY